MILVGLAVLHKIGSKCLAESVAETLAICISVAVALSRDAKLNDSRLRYLLLHN
uniref:Predicted protein n=1 Tax=Hordeum vulgare subsp. vulgare TaxID=112509 RepID=F2EBJ1_HORVV|nr:predicted protein [Hordeum vulgare subsp. vulgare]